MRFNIDVYEMDLWESALKKETAKLKRLQANADNDPLTNLFKIHSEFKELLDSGESRTSEPFMKKIKDLAAREKVEKARSKKFDLIRELNAVSVQQLLVSQVSNRFANIKYRRELKYGS